MNRLRFNDLPPPVRERFVQIGRSPGVDPRVISFHKTTSGIWAAYVFGVLALVALVPIFNFTITRGQQVDPYHDREVYLMLAGAVAVILVSLSAIVFRAIWKPPPYSEGVYIFHSYLVQTRGGELTLMSLADIGTPTIVTVRRNGAYQHTRLELGGPFTVYHNSDQNAKNAWERIATSRGRWRALLANRDAAGIAQVDPFVECTTSGAWQYPQQQLVPPLADTRPGYLWVLQWGAAALIGLGVSGVYYLAIDNIFDDERTAYANRFRTPTPAAPRRR